MYPTKDRPQQISPRQLWLTVWLKRVTLGTITLLYPMLRIDCSSAQPIQTVLDEAGAHPHLHPHHGNFDS